MNKAELVETLIQMGVSVRKEWTVPELRSIVSEQRGADQRKELKGLSKCREMGVDIPPKPTRGLLMRMIRDSVPATQDEVVPFGRYKGYRYCEVPFSYLEWAIVETKMACPIWSAWPRT